MCLLRIAPSPDRQRPPGEEGLCIEPPAPGRAVAAAPAVRAAAVPSLPAQLILQQTLLAVIHGYVALAAICDGKYFPATMYLRMSIPAVVSRPRCFCVCLCRQLFPGHDASAYVCAGSYSPATMYLRMSAPAVISRPRCICVCLHQQLFPGHDVSAAVCASSYFPAGGCGELEPRALLAPAENNCIPAHSSPTAREAPRITASQHTLPRPPLRGRE